MQKFSTFSERTIKYHHTPYSSTFISEKISPDYNVILFFVAAESYPHISKESIKIINRAKPQSSNNFCDIVGLPDSEIPLFLESLYGVRESIALFPLGRKTLAVFNPLLRSCGLGLAFIFHHSPSYVSALLDSDLFSGTRLSPTFSSLSKRRGSSLAFTNSFTKVFHTMEQCLKKNTASADLALNIITSAADIIGISITTELHLDDISDRPFDSRALCAFSILLLSMAQQLSSNDSVTVNISGGRRRTVSMDFDLSEGIDPTESIPTALFCEKLADELHVPFCIDIENRHCHAILVPFREDPSLFGLKTGIFIDQKRFTRMPL